MKFRHFTALIVLIASMSGCYMVADPDRKIIAKFGDEEISRGDLKEIIGNLPDEQKPLIQSRSDLLDFLNSHLEGRIKETEARELRIDGKIEVDRNQARAIYLARHPEYAPIENATDPTGIGISKGELIALQAEMAFGIDDIEAILYQDAAFEYLVQQYIQQERPQISDADFESAYAKHKNSLMTFETIEFYGMRFPEAPGARQEAVKARKRIADGEEFDAVLESYLNISEQLGISAALENNPTNPKFAQFWYTVTGAQEGDIFGPVHLEAYDQLITGPDGRPVAQRQPEAWAVIKVVKAHAPRQKTLDESKQDLAMPILREQVMAQLREQYGVEVYPDELPRPEGYGDQFKNQMIKTRIGE